MVGFHDEVRQRFGVLPNFFRLAPENPEITQNLWGFARFGYLDNPLPSLFKERLFVWLSRFCEVRYCIARHVGFLIGLGTPAGDASCPPQSVDDVLRLLSRPLPRGGAMREHNKRCAAFANPLTEMPPPDSEMEWSIFACATHVFLQTPAASECQAALERVLGISQLQYLLVFLAFVRAAHYWTRVHSDLALEEDIDRLLTTHEQLRRCLLDDPEAGCGKVDRDLIATPATLEPERLFIDARQESAALLQQELADSRLLHDISIELIGEQNMATLYGKIVGAAARLMRSPCATMQMLREERGGDAELQLLGYRGIPPEVAAGWQRMRTDTPFFCAIALARNERVIVPDVDRCDFIVDAEALASFHYADIRAVQSTPLKTRTGTLVGMISTHWHMPHTPSARELHLLDILARQAADLIERAKVEETLRESEEQLRESDRMKDQFLATLAHELRNPLAPICNALQLLRLSDRAADAERLLDMLDRQVNHVVQLVNDLLEMSRISRGAIELKHDLLELTDVLRTATDASKPLIENGRHRLELRFPEGRLLVHGDAVRLTQVFTNLLNNAAKYTDDGGRIELSVRRDNEHVVVSVCDNGIGIAPEQLPRLFQMFAQANPGNARGQGGLGIGLSLAQRLVGMHRGTIDARSNGLGQGSCFTVRLPLALHGISPEAPTHSASTAGLQNLRILIVDDNRDAGDSLGMLLRFLGADIRVERDGVAALGALEEFQPAVVLLDLGMPDMDGYEVARRIRANARNAGIMLVATTGWGQQQDQARTRAAGFDHHLIKPINLEVLEALLKHIERNGLPRGAKGH
jgi:signal transduction histidine kinase/ActR/RegA family two-component response regulator